MLFRAVLYLCFVSASLTFAQDVIEHVAPLPANSIISGRVYYGDTGRPVRRTVITLMTKTRFGQEYSALTDGDGNYEIRNVRAGTYYPVIDAPGILSPLAYADLAGDRSGSFDQIVTGFSPIVVDGTNGLEANIPAKRGGAISGRIVYADGDPAIGVRVEVLRKGAETFIPVMPNLSSIVSLTNGGAGVYQTDDRGYFRSAGLPAGKYIVRITEKGLHNEKAERNYRAEPDIFGGDSLLTMYYPDVFEMSLARVVDLEPGQENPEISIVIPDRELRKVSGKVVSAKGKVPLQGARLTLTRKGEANSATSNEFSRVQISISTDEKGNWSFEQLPKGTYEIKVEPNLTSYNEREKVYGSNIGGNYLPRYDPKKEVKFARRVREVVLDDKDLSDVLIELVPSAMVSGDVTVEGKGFPKSVTVAIVDENELELASGSAWRAEFGDEQTVETYFNRAFKLEKVPPGKGFLRISVSDDEFYVKSARLGAVDLLADPVELKEGQIVRNLRIVLGTDVGTVKGKIVDDKDAPAAQVILLLMPVDIPKHHDRDNFRQVVTNEKGEFETRVAPGKYAVVFKGRFGNAKGAELYKLIEEASKDTVKIKVEPGGTHKLSLRKDEGKKP